MEQGKKEHPEMLNSKAHEAVVIALHSLYVYCLTCRPENSTQWLVGLVARLNAAAGALGEGSRYSLDDTNSVVYS
jgi:hypothetical protein